MESESQAHGWILGARVLNPEEFLKLATCRPAKSGGEAAWVCCRVLPQRRVWAFGQRVTTHVDIVRNKKPKKKSSIKGGD
jgi:hypothetical protein